MKVITTYIAFDGEEFANEKDCLKHEAEMRKGTEKIMFYTRDMKPIENVFGERMEETFFITVNTIEDIEIVKRIFNYHGLPTPWFHSDLSPLVGLYYWSNKDQEWHHWQTEMRSLTALGNYFQQFEEEENS
jgi:hypothetical protein